MDQAFVSWQTLRIWRDGRLHLAGACGICQLRAATLVEQKVHRWIGPHKLAKAIRGIAKWKARKKI
jgi:hypothetical protein